MMSHGPAKAHHSCWAFNLTTAELGSVPQIGGHLPDVARDGRVHLRRSRLLNALTRRHGRQPGHIHVQHCCGEFNSTGRSAEWAVTAFAATTGGGEPAIRADFKALSSAVMGAGSSENCLHNVARTGAFSAHVAGHYGKPDHMGHARRS